MRKQKGFSLIELLIVVAIILIIAAIAVPNLLKSKMAANEASAAASMRTVGTANVTYSSTFNQGFAGALAQLGPGGGPPDTSSNANLIDSTLGQDPATKSGYTFTYVPGAQAVPSPSAPNGSYQLTASPVSPTNTGTSTFCLDQTNVVLKDPSGTVVTANAPGCVQAGTLLPM